MLSKQKSRITFRKFSSESKRANMLRRGGGRLVRFARNRADSDIVVIYLSLRDKVHQALEERHNVTGVKIKVRKQKMQPDCSLTI